MRRFTLQFLAGLLAGLILATASFSLAAPRSIKLIVNGREIPSDPAPVTIQDRVFVPVRFVAEALGAKVDWNETDRAVRISSRQIESPEGYLSLNELAAMFQFSRGAIRQLPPEKEATGEQPIFVRIEKNGHYVDLPCSYIPDGPVEGISDTGVLVHGLKQNGRIYVSESDLREANIIP